MQELAVSVLMSKDEKAKLAKSANKKAKKPPVPSFGQDISDPKDDFEEMLKEEVDRMPDPLKDLAQDLRIDIPYIPIHHHTSTIPTSWNIVHHRTTRFR